MKKGGGVNNAESRKPYANQYEEMKKRSLIAQLPPQRHAVARSSTRTQPPSTQPTTDRLPQPSAPCMTPSSQLYPRHRPGRSLQGPSNTSRIRIYILRYEIPALDMRILHSSRHAKPGRRERADALVSGLPTNRKETCESMPFKMSH
jgi:hypothetical protein